MRQTFILVLFIIVSINSRAQDVDPYTLEPADYHYHPVNTIIKNNRIKCLVDSSPFILTGTKCRAWVYDTLGRLAGELSQPGGALKYIVVYKTSGDTTWRMHYDTGKTVLYAYQQFVYNKKGQIISYLDCGNYYIKDDSYYVGYEVFFYNGEGRLQSRHLYTREDYPGKLSVETIIKPTELHLDDAVNYTLSPFKNGNKLVIGQHTIGKPDWRVTDSIVYDKQNRITRVNSFAKKRTVGEFVGNNVNTITLYQYEDRSLQITRYTTYCYPPGSSNDCLNTTETEKQVTLILYNHNKTLSEKYGYNQSGQRYLSDKYGYTYY